VHSGWLKGTAPVSYDVRFYRMRDRSQRRGRVRGHPDARVQAVVEQVREAEMIQAIDRLRLIHCERRKTVYILCSIPLEHACR
jgi:hypothetical protein